MRRCPGKRYAITGELPQRCNWKISPVDACSADRRKADAAHAHCRPSPGTAEREGGNDLVRKIAGRNCRSPGEARADDFVFKSTRLLYFAPVQRLWRSA